MEKLKEFFLIRRIYEEKLISIINFYYYNFNGKLFLDVSVFVNELCIGEF